MPIEARIESFQAGDSAVTYNVPSAASRTLVALSSAAPTVSRHANATFSSVSGALRTTSATTAGMTWLALITDPIVAGLSAQLKSV